MGQVRAPPRRSSKAVCQTDCSPIDASFSKIRAVPQIQRGAAESRLVTCPGTNGPRGLQKATTTHSTAWEGKTEVATVTRIRDVTAGGWRTLETFWNATAQGVFRLPAGARIKVRYGFGWLGWDSQSQTLDGANPRTLEITSGASKARARMQMTVVRDSEVQYVIHLPGP